MHGESETIQEFGCKVLFEFAGDEASRVKNAEDWNRNSATHARSSRRADGIALCQGAFALIKVGRHRRILRIERIERKGIVDREFYQEAEII
eukprot:1643002-Rhodomonas_salina.4